MAKPRTDGSLEATGTGLEILNLLIVDVFTAGSTLPGSDVMLS